MILFQHVSTLHMFAKILFEPKILVVFQSFHPIRTTRTTLHFCMWCFELLELRRPDFNIYEASLPYAMQRALFPKTKAFPDPFNCIPTATKEFPIISLKFCCCTLHQQCSMYELFHELMNTLKVS